MSTNYDRLPTLEERVRASSLIVTARVQSIRLLPRARIGDIDEEQAIASVAIEKVLRGKPTAHELDVRFVRSRRAGPFSRDQRLVLLLVPDVGRDTRPNTYVAYLRGAFPLTANDAFTMETKADTSKGGARKTRLTLSALRDVVRAVTAEETIETKAWTRLEPQLAKRPALPAITELPDVGPGVGPTSAGPAAPEATRTGRRKSVAHPKKRTTRG